MLLYNKHVSKEERRNMELLIGFLLGLASNLTWDAAKLVAGKAKAHVKRTNRKGKHSK